MLFSFHHWLLQEFSRRCGCVWVRKGCRKRITPMYVRELRQFWHIYPRMWMWNLFMDRENQTTRAHERPEVGRLYFLSCFGVCHSQKFVADFWEAEKQKEDEFWLNHLSHDQVTIEVGHFFFAFRCWAVSRFTVCLLKKVGLLKRCKQHFSSGKRELPHD